jgi:hypothetical protein
MKNDGMTDNQPGKPTPASMGYQSAYKRPRCGNCLHLDERFTHEESYNERRYLYCGIGGYKVSAAAVCKQYRRSP